MRCASLQKLGWIEGRNVQIDARWGAGSAEPTQQFAKELVELKPDLILSHSTQVVEGTALSVAEFPNKNLINDFLLKSVGDTSRLDTDVERSLTDTAG
jgi:hypothetical protein